MALQISNSLLIIRHFTKYIIEIETETTLLEQLNSKPNEIISSNSSVTGASKIIIF
jgi:hypothetical protein